MKKRAGLDLTVLLVINVIVLLSICLCACNSVNISEGTVIKKIYGAPVRASFGIIDIMATPRDNYCILVEDAAGNTQWFIVSEATYARTAVGSSFIYESGVHSPL